MNENEEFEENKIKLKDNKIIHPPIERLHILSNLFDSQVSQQKTGIRRKRKAQVEGQEIDIKLVNDATNLLLAELWKKQLRMLPRKISPNATTENTWPDQAGILLASQKKG